MSDAKEATVASEAESVTAVIRDLRDGADRIELSFFGKKEFAAVHEVDESVVSGDQWLRIEAWVGGVRRYAEVAWPVLTTKAQAAFGS